MSDLNQMSYEKAGVSIKAQNEANAEVIRRLRSYGMRADGLFGGAVDISEYKGQCSLVIKGNCESVYRFLKSPDFLSAPEQSRFKKIGEMTFVSCYGKAIEDRYCFTPHLGESTIPVAALDYFASETMDNSVADFVEGAVIGSVMHGKRIPIIGGESAEMKGTYLPGRYDGFVHIISLASQGSCDTVQISHQINNMERPLIVATTDAIGTKTKIIKNPEDIIYHGFNDLGAQGVRPIAFMLYVAGNTTQEELDEIVKNSKSVCSKNRITQIDSTSVRNEDYLPGEVDIAGTVIGVIDAKDLITGKDVKPYDQMIGIATDGLGTNGYTFAREICNEQIRRGNLASMTQPTYQLNGKSVYEELSKPHRPVNDLLFGADGIEGVLTKFPGAVKGTAHITGGGLADNMIRMIPDDCTIEYRPYFAPPPIMKLFLNWGISSEKMYEAFNMGVGFTLTVERQKANDIVHHINENFRHRIEGVDRRAGFIGEIQQRQPKFHFYVDPDID